MHGRTWLSTATPTLRNAAVKKSRTDWPTTGLFSEAGQLGASIKFASVTMGWRSCHGPRPCGARFNWPALARPELLRWAARVRHSRLSNLKELRPGSAGRSGIRILYIFDPRRNTVLLAAGDKAGKSETS